MSETPRHPSTPPDGVAPDRSAVLKYLMFTLSLPERTLRSTVGLVGGAAQEAASLLLPRAFRDSKTYQALIHQNLQYLLKNVGGVQSASSVPPPGSPATSPGESPGGPPAEAEVENYVARKTIGNFVDAVGLLTFHLSPVVILAVLSDVAHGSNAYLKELAKELKQQGLIAEDSTIHHADDLLSAVAAASRQSADAMNTPPLSLEGLKETIDQTRRAVSGIDPSKVIPTAEVKRMWDEMQAVARQEGVSLWTVSTTMTMQVLSRIGAVGRGVVAGVTVAGGLFQSQILSHYAAALRTVNERGLYQVLADSWRPYFDAVWNNFALDKATVTEEVVTGRLLVRMWSWLCGCFRKTP